MESQRLSNGSTAAQILSGNYPTQPSSIPTQKSKNAEALKSDDVTSVAGKKRRHTGPTLNTQDLPTVTGRQITHTEEEHSASLVVSFPMQLIQKGAEAAKLERERTIQPVIYKIPAFPCPAQNDEEHEQHLIDFLQESIYKPFSLSKAAKEMGFTNKNTLKLNFLNKTNKKATSFIEGHFGNTDWSQAQILIALITSIEASMSESRANCISVPHFLDYLKDSDTPLYVWLRNASDPKNISITDGAKLWVKYRLKNSKIHFGTTPWTIIKKNKDQKSSSPPQKRKKQDSDEYTPDLTMEEFERLEQALKACDSRLTPQEVEAEKHKARIKELMAELEMQQTQLQQLESSMHCTQLQWDLAMHQYHFMNTRPIPEHLKGVSLPK
ncbi:hypothetical protein M3P05_05585 [Sansalvadorimonas sp. 2012CJ34-2]|uniref:Uncharacterized protein n=1 Tax=Parendozoicomonas callyspongiae TaxID=2942213 RepID=A0ABT0PDW3_9GAMM|nr:hypothetical protein [Sansalvadorimonas sp. 2012CJ34-2]MCL6269416.1 hypothetical protein [Sansalvadorimonas sp. 2012CJ34-2]